VFSTSDTIVAIATGASRGGIGIVRLSGPAAAPIAMALTGRDRPLRPRHATFATLRGGSGSPATAIEPATAIDQVVVTWFPAPRSYTGEDVVEVGAHGNPLLLRQIVSLVLQRGARLAEPGEFTLRAYLNGRLDLVQAESVRDLIDAVTPLQARAAMDQLQGTLTTRIARIDAALFDLAARLEASLDFPDEGFHFIDADAARADLTEARAVLGTLIADGRRGRIIREGALVVIVGRTNVGKSSLFNALVGSARAIVTPVAGTTRDLVTEVIDLGGIPVTMVDTAGLRVEVDSVEAEGIRRAEEARQVATVLLVVIDGTADLGPDDIRLMEPGIGPRIIVVSKADQPLSPDVSTSPLFSSDEVVRVSALTGDGLTALRARIVDRLTTDDGPDREVPALTNIRHLALVERAAAAVDLAMETLDSGATEELVLAELAAARQALEEIVGKRPPDELLHHIFSRFCIGK
jgi:tRNA modification GTPase